MGYDRMEQEKSPTEMMYGLTRAFYEEKDAEKILGFYDPKAICWFGMTERGEAYHIQSLREKLQTIFENMQKTCMEKENYRVVTENNKSCMISGNLALLENGERIENEISAFWTFFQGVWYLSRFSIQHAGMTPEPEKEAWEEKLDLEKSRNQTLMNLIQGSVLEYDVLKDQLDLYIQRSMREPKKHMVYPDLVKSGKTLFQAAVHPDDREKLEKAFLKNQDYRIIEFRFQEKEGFYSWKRLTLQKVRDSKGKLLRILGNVVDISLERELLEEARKDSLTGAYNRYGLRTSLESYCGELKRRKRGVKGAVLLLDLDNFKNLNDTCGHPAGDQVLKDLVELLKSHFRSDDKIFRMGGDEFLILMKDIPGKEIVCRKGQAIVEDFSKYAAQYDTHGIPLSLSIGAVVFSGKSSGSREIYQRADEALYKVKRSGKKGIRIDET